MFPERIFVGIYVSTPNISIIVGLYEPKRKFLLLFSVCLKKSLTWCRMGTESLWAGQAGSSGADSTQASMVQYPGQYGTIPSPVWYSSQASMQYPGKYGTVFKLFTWNNQEACLTGQPDGKNFHKLVK